MQKQVKLRNDIFKTNIFGKKTKILCKGTYADLLEEKVIIQQRDIYTLNRDDVEIIDIGQLKGIFANVNDDELLRENGLLFAENKQLKEVIEEVREYIETWNVPECDRGTMREISFSSSKEDLLQILDKAKDD